MTQKIKELIQKKRLNQPPPAVESSPHKLLQTRSMSTLQLQSDGKQQNQTLKPSTLSKLFTSSNNTTGHSSSEFPRVKLMAPNSSAFNKEQKAADTEASQTSPQVELMQQNSQQRLKFLLKPGSKLLSGLNENKQLLLDNTREASNVQLHEEGKTMTVMAITESSKTPNFKVLNSQQKITMLQQQEGNGSDGSSF